MVYLKYIIWLSKLIFYWMIKSMTKINLEEKGVILTFNSQLIFYQWENSGQEHGGRFNQRPWKNTIYFLLVLLCFVFFMDFSAYFPIKLRPTCTGLVATKVDEHLPHQLSTTKMPDILVYNPMLWRHFLNWESIFHNYLSLYQLTHPNDLFSTWNQTYHY